jgi:hypothetical protein
MGTIISAIAGVLVGGIVTWAVARYYYKKASEELQKEAHELRRLNELMLLGMEHAGWIELSRNNSGKIVGFRQVIAVSSISSEEKFGTPTITVAPPKSNT